jgi:hypothetical protein
MDRFADGMIVRGPTLVDDDTASGSVHILDPPDPAAARAFAFEEPNYQAGVYRDVLIRRRRNLLGRTMWEFAGGREGGERFLVLGRRCEEDLRYLLCPVKGSRGSLVRYVFDGWRGVGV